MKHFTSRLVSHVGWPHRCHNFSLSGLILKCTVAELGFELATLWLQVLCSTAGPHNQSKCQGTPETLVLAPQGSPGYIKIIYLYYSISMQGADFVEFDIHVTKDRVPVIGHDFQAALTAQVSIYYITCAPHGNQICVPLRYHMYTTWVSHAHNMTSMWPRTQCRS